MAKKPIPKRKPAFAFDRSRPVPLSQVINFGPVTLAEFEAVGIHTLDQIEELGFEETARKWVAKFPERIYVNAFLGIAATLDGIAWTAATERHRAMARALVNELRAEIGLPLVKPSKARRRGEKSAVQSSKRRG